MRSVQRPAGIGTDSRQGGSALIWAMFFVAVTSGLLLSHSWEMRANRREMDVRYRQAEQARTLAGSGLTEATNWLQRQVVQPVLAFAPQRDLTATPAIDDTIDPALGIVREFEIRGSLWGRYEVRTTEANDISATYHLAAGSVWDLGARGILFERQDANHRYDQYPNRVIAVQTMRTEVRNTPVSVPAASAIAVADPGNLLLGSGTTLNGNGNPAIATTGLGIPALSLAGLNITGAPSTLTLPILSTAPEQLFAMRPDRLERFADVSIAGERLPQRPLDGELLFAPANLKINARSPLTGTGVVVVMGDLTADAGNSSVFNGLVIVKGAASINGPFTLNGTMAVSGQLSTDATKGEVAFQYSSAAMAKVATAMSQYRSSKDKRPASGK